MSGNKTLMDGPKRSAFAESAARLDAIARPLEQNSPMAPAADRMTAVSPDEAWSRRFMSTGIGPDLAKPYEPAPPIPQPQLAPVEEIVAPAASLHRAFGRPDMAGPIGLAIGKPVKRPLLARLFGRG